MLVGRIKKRKLKARAQRGGGAEEECTGRRPGQLVRETVMASVFSVRWGQEFC